MENFDSRYFRGQGPLFLGDRLSDGSPTNLIFVGDLSSVEITPNISRSERPENVTGKGYTVGSFIQQTQYDVTIAFRSIKQGHFEFAIGADVTTQASSSVTGEEHTVKVGAFARLKHLKVSNVAVTIDPNGTATSGTEGTDYKVHGDEGLIEILSGGGISDDDVIGVDYDYAAQTDFLVNPGNDTKYAVFAGMNSADDDKQTRCEMYKLRLDPSALSAITDEQADMSVGGRLLADTIRPQGDRVYRWITED